MSSASHYRRCDGAGMTAEDLTECVPIHPTELEELVWPIDLVEDWLLHASHAALADLVDFCNRSLNGPGHGPGDVTEQLGRAGVTLHRLIHGARNRR